MYEPFNSDAPNNLGIAQRFLHITAENAAQYAESVRSLYDLADWKTRVPRGVRAVLARRGFEAEPADVLARQMLIQTPATFLRASRICFKDPLAFFASEWFAETLGTKIVVMLRHPAGVISSYLKLGWSPEVEALLQQPSIEKRFLGGMRREIDAYQRNQDDPLQGHILQWKIFAHAALQLRQAHPDWLFVRHEDLCRDPLEQFRAICDYADIPWTSRLRRKIRRDSSERNEVDAAEAVQHAHRRASSGLANVWQDRLQSETIDRITQETADLWGKMLSI